MGPSGSPQIPRWESLHTPTMDTMSHSVMVNPVTVSHDRTRPLTNNSGHCLETRMGPHLDGDETVSPDSTTVISNNCLPILLMLFMTAPGSLQKLQATVLKLMQNFSWRMLIQLRHLPCLGI